MKRTNLLMVLIISLFVIQLPDRVESAQDENVLIINGASVPGFLGMRVNATNTLRRLIANRGFTATVSQSVPANLSQFDCVFDIRFANNRPITPEEQAAFVSYLAGGGRLYITGENKKLSTRNSSVLSLIEAAGGGSLTFCDPVTEGLLPQVNIPTCTDPFICSTPNGIDQVVMVTPGATIGSGTGTPLLATTDEAGQECHIATVWQPGQLFNAPTGMLIAMFDVDILTRSLPDLRNDNLNLVDNIVTFLCSPNDPPVALCRDLTKVADDKCLAGATAEEVDNGSFDPDGDPITLSIDPAGPYPLGTTEVTLTVMDDQGLESTCRGTVTVVDTTRPRVSCPADMTVECTSPEGATVSFPEPEVSDNCDANPLVSYSPPSGSLLPIGTTPVICTVTDAGGNSSRCSFRVTVVDTTPPSINCPSDITVECAGPGGTVVTFTTPATDACDPNPTVVAAPPSGSSFHLGTTTVTATAFDASGNSSSCTFRVNVVDTTPPTISCPPLQTLLCSSPEGAVVTLPARAFDTCDPNPVVVCTPPSGSVFPLGTTTVTCTAIDSSGNIATCTTTVTVFNDAPTADAGPDLTVDEGDLVQLLGRGFDLDSAHSLIFEWTQKSGQAVTFITANEPTASFIAPNVPVGNCDSLTFELKVIDTCGAVATDTVEVKVRDRIEGVGEMSGSCVKVTVDCDTEKPTTGTYCWKTPDGRVFSGPVLITRRESIFGRLRALHIRTLPEDENQLRLNVDQPTKGTISGRLSVPQDGGGIGRQLFTLRDGNREESSCDCP